MRGGPLIVACAIGFAFAGCDANSAHPTEGATDRLALTAEFDAFECKVVPPRPPGMSQPILVRDRASQRRFAVELKRDGSGTLEFVSVTETGGGLYKVTQVAIDEPSMAVNTLRGPGPRSVFLDGPDALRTEQAVFALRMARFVADGCPA